MTKRNSTYCRFFGLLPFVAIGTKAISGAGCRGKDKLSRYEIAGGSGNGKDATDVSTLACSADGKWPNEHVCYKSGAVVPYDLCHFNYGRDAENCVDEDYDGLPKWLEDKCHTSDEKEQIPCQMNDDQQELAEDELWGGDVPVKGADEKERRMTLHYSFDNPASPIAFKDINNNSERTGFGVLILPTSADKFKLLWFEGDATDAQLSTIYIMEELPQRAWTHFGKFVFSSNISGNFENWIAIGDGFHPRQISGRFGDTARGIFARRPRFAPDASAIVFENNTYSFEEMDNWWARGYHLYYIENDSYKNQVSVPLFNGTSRDELDYEFRSSNQIVTDYRLTTADSNHTQVVWLRCQFNRTSAPRNTTMNMNANTNISTCLKVASSSKKSAHERNSIRKNEKIYHFCLSVK